MNSYTLQLSQPQIEQLQQFYQHNLVKAVPYSQFRAQITGVTITAYNSGKVLFQGKGASSELAELAKIYPFIVVEDDKTLGSESPVVAEQGNIIGSDEVGNGSYFGPLTVCAVYLKADQVDLVKELGAKDSKNLSDSQIRHIAADLKHTVKYHLTVCPPDKYNQAIEKGYNAVSIKVSLHNFTLAKLWEQIEVDHRREISSIIVDEFTSSTNYQKYLKKEKYQFPENLQLVQKAENQYLAVACASIIARDAFLTGLEELGQKYGGRSLPSGAGPNVDRFGLQLVSKLGLGVLQNTAKLHFKNTEKIKKLLK